MPSGSNVSSSHSPSRRLQRKLNIKVSDSLPTGDTNGMGLPQKRAKCSQKSESFSKINFIQTNDILSAANPLVGFSNNRSAVEDSNNIRPKISDTAEDKREKAACAKVYRREYNKRLFCGSARGHFKGQSTNENHNASTSGRSFCMTKEDFSDAGKFAPGNSISSTGMDIGRWCESILKNMGKFRSSSRTCGDIKHPGVVGDGMMDQKCKKCHNMEDRETLICDMCEESFHISCLKRKFRAEGVEDWYCPTCQIERKKCQLERKKIQIERKKYCFNCREKCTYSYIFEQMFDENVEYNNKVRIGSKYQADIPEQMGQPLEYSGSPFVGNIALLEETERENAETNFENNKWQTASSLSPMSKENWLKCNTIIYHKGDSCPGGQNAETDILCGKWRRAPLSKVQNDEWECSDAVVWDPHHADCFVPQELETAEIERCMEERKRSLEVAMVQEQGRRRVRHCKSR
ncbi:uncharacterized protein LOC131075830 isoform X2 [Cryptomeria japonica]|uniref:uncharacterized protein LOC131075830 isoform X2 n=1 Tax=Cryptomeria japonica TaxID=3369 RepID=UPI0027DA5DBE|nr:uncharacterized protein LOC131075830 isoform X2 [Cryptomeria japonica]